jgi:uncharacterized protein
MNIAFPYRVGRLGRTGEPDGEDGHIRDMIEQVLFTTPGERVNRPDFGCGLLHLVFAPNSDEIGATLQMLVQASLQQWLGSVLRIDEVRATSDDATLAISVRYTVLRTQDSRTADFARPAPS